MSLCHGAWLIDVVAVLSCHAFVVVVPDKDVGLHAGTVGLTGLTSLTKGNVIFRPLMFLRC